MSDYKYETLTDDDLIRIADERLAALERDHANIRFSHEPQAEARLKEYEERIAYLKEEIKAAKRK